AVEASTLGGGRLRVECDVVVVACGAIATPLLLARNGLGGESGELGRNLSIHPATGVRALFDEDVDMATGVPQSYYIDEFGDAGAKVVYPPVEGLGELHDGDVEPLRQHPMRPHDLILLAFHPLGTARADARAGHGVVDADLKLRGVEGVYVADGSVVPSSIGVNPQITIMSLATRAAYRLLGKPAPDEEPEPEAIAEPRIRRPHA